MAMKKAEQVMKKRKLSGPLKVLGVTSCKKQGPVVRVVHVFPPVVVQVEKSNFCSLVQKLTGKQSAATATSQPVSLPPPPPSPSSSSSSSEDQDHQLVKIQPYVQNNITSASPLPCSDPSDLSDIHMINDHQHAYYLHSDHFSLSLINDAALPPPTYTSSAGSFYHAECHDSDEDDTPFFDYFDYDHLIDLPALPQVMLDQEDERWLECSFIKACLDQSNSFTGSNA